MRNKTNRKAFSLVELIVTLAIVTLILGYVWQIYFSGRETMSNTVSQSQMQSDTRLFLDHFDNQMASCYSFYEMNPEQNKFGFYSFVFARTPLDMIIYDTSGNAMKTGSTSQQKIKVVRYEYVWADSRVKLNRTPGWLYFLQKPMKFVEDSAGTSDDMYTKMSKIVLRNISEFEFKGYEQHTEIVNNKTVLKINEVLPANATSTVFIALRIHTKKDEGEKHRDEELDVVTKFYSKVRLNAAMNKGYFCTTDQNGKF